MLPAGFVNMVCDLSSFRSFGYPVHKLRFRLKVGALMVEEGTFEERAGGVATEVSVAEDDTVAGYEDEEGVVRYGVGNGTRCGWVTGGSG